MARDGKVTDEKTHLSFQVADLDSEGVVRVSPTLFQSLPMYFHAVCNHKQFESSCSS
jgi:hypothetical protein